MPTLGTCKLCLEPDVRLLRSHYVPAASYRLLRRFPEGPLVIISQSAAVQTDNQMTAYLLCEKCEERLRQGGEDWVMAHCYRPEGFKLQELLRQAPLRKLDGAPTRDGISAYVAAEIESINVKALTYLAASIVWRGTVHAWKCGKENITRVSLGPT